MKGKNNQLKEAKEKTPLKTKISILLRWQPEFKDAKCLLKRAVILTSDQHNSNCKQRWLFNKIVFYEYLIIYITFPCESENY